MDSFCEHLIKRQKKTSEKVSCIILVLLGIFLTIAAVIWLFPFVHSIFRDGASLIFPLIIAMWWGILILIKKYNIEYEYALTGSDMDVDKIINMRKRQKVVSASIRTMAIVAPVKSSYYTDSYKNMITVDCSSGKKDANTYFAIYMVDGQQKCLLFDPTEKMINHIKLYCKETF